MTRGIQFHRLKDNPMEARFAEAWSHQQAATRNLAYILDAHTPSDRDQVVAATVVQWLGSPVGQSFLADTLGFDGLERIMALVSHDGQRGEV